MAGSPAESFSPSHGIEMRQLAQVLAGVLERRKVGHRLARRARTAAAGRGRAAGRRALPWETTTSSVAVPVGLCRRTAVLRPPIGGLVLGALHHRATVHLDQLVDQAGGRGARSR